MRLTIRVYAFLTNSKNEVLLLDEQYQNHRFTKLPGGGLEKGEGVLDGIKRELKEELGLTGLELKQFHTTEIFVESKLHKNTQVIAIYYKAILNMADVEINPIESNLLNKKWIPTDQLQASHFTFKTDREALRVFLP